MGSFLEADTTSLNNTQRLKAIESNNIAPGLTSSGLQIASQLHVRVEP
jgi:hypothetical protein